MKKALSFLLILTALTVNSQVVTITIDASQNRKPVSPALYGKNNSLSEYSSEPLSTAEWQRLKDAGIKLFRENSGNNATKYNWRLKLTSAPDWYNNVYGADWDYEAKSLQQNIPGAKGMYAFQLIGKAASNTTHNFDDWAYNYAQWWPGTAQNLAGGGTVNTDWNATNALIEGAPNLYLKNWTADSTVGILDKWFGTGSGSLNLSKTAFQYWNMDNEPEIWETTHDDVMPHQLSAEAFMQRYFAVALKARAKYPEIKLVGAVPCAEWFWFAWPDGTGNSGKISYKGNEYTWIEYFIKRIGEKQDSTKIRLLDVVDLHTYLSADTDEQLLQLHRVFYDKTFDYPYANGIKLLGANGWDASITKEYIFTRINEWLTQYLGANHGVTLGSTESGWKDGFNQMPLALNYASTLGVFANEGVEVFTPWFWSPSYWEVVHLFSRYNKKISVKSTSSDENNVSAYSTVNASNDSITVVLVNRNSSAKSVTVNLSNISISNGTYQVFTLNNLPADNSTETFVSHSSNALKSTTAIVANGALSISVPALSITSVILAGVSTPKTDPVITWINPLAITYGTLLSSTQLNATANVAGTFAYNPASGAKLNAGTQSLSVTFTPTDIVHYNSISKSVTISVSKATPVITWNNPANIVYGTNLGATQLNAVSSVPGTYTYSPISGTKLNAGTKQNLSISFTPTDATNYNVASKTVSITVTKATPVITWNNPADISTSTPLSATQLNATANTTGTFVYSPAIGTQLSEGANKSLSVTFTPSVLTNYTIATKTVTINVTNPLKTNPVITWASPSEIMYGTALGSNQLNATAVVAGSFTYTPSAGTILNAGNAQNLSVSFTPSNATLYNTVSKSVTISVKKVTSVITWENPDDIVAGTLLSNTQLNATANIAGNFLYSPAIGTLMTAGVNQPLSVVFKPNDTTNYTVVSKTVKINVTWLEIVKSDPILTWSNPADIEEGVKLSNLQLNATANVPGTFIYTPSIGAQLAAGNNQTLNVYFTPTDEVHYNIISKSVSINVKGSNAIKASEADKPFFYPNPVKDQLYFSKPEQVQKYQLCSLTGAVLVKGDNGFKPIDFTNLSAGVYFITISLNNQNKVFKIIKE